MRNNVFCCVSAASTRRSSSSIAEPARCAAEQISSEYYVAVGAYRPFTTAWLPGADWMSAVCLSSQRPDRCLWLGHPALAGRAGWTGGFVLVLILVKLYGAVSARRRCWTSCLLPPARTLPASSGVIVLVCCSFTYVTAQIDGTKIIASRFLVSTV